MATKTIPQLAEATSFDGSALFVFDSGVQTFKVSTSNAAKSLEPLQRPTVQTKDSNYTVLPGDSLIRVSGNITITMPDAATVTGRRYTIKKTDSGTTTSIEFDGAQTADGESSLSLTEQFSFYQLQSNGVGYDIVAAG